jgi:hypothetical protein
MFLRALNRSFWVLYDNLFKGLLINIILFALMFIPFFILWNKKLYVPTILTVGALWFMLVPAVIYYFSKIVREEERGGMWSSLWEGFKRFWWRGLVIFASVAAVTALAVIAFYFYRANAKNMFALIAGGVTIWIAFTFLLMQIYMMPIMVLDEKARVFTSFKKALIMVLSVPFSSIFITAVIAYFDILFYPIALWIGGPHVGWIIYLTMFPIFLMPFVSLVFIIILQLNSTILIYEKHNVYPDLKAVWEERDLSNLFRPWEVK